MDNSNLNAYYSLKEKGKHSDSQAVGETSEETETVVRRSRFVGSAKRVFSKEEVTSFIKERMSRHPQANHLVWAYRIDSKRGIEHYSDAGEPAGSAGYPVFGVLMRHNLEKTVLTVTRYFGGIKLGISGLIDAYASSAEKTVVSAGIALYRPFREYALVIDYPGWPSLRHFLVVSGIEEEKMRIVYGERISITFFSPIEYEEIIRSELQKYVAVRLIERYNESKPVFLAQRQHSSKTS